MRENHSDTEVLLRAKRDRGLRISVCLPARNEEATVGHIVATVRRSLCERLPLVDEVLVLDDGSTDATAEAARWEGARVLAVEEVLPALGPGSGKGNALWKSLFASDGDILCWLDADVLNFRPHFVTRLIAPLLIEPGTRFVKAYYRRPLGTTSTGGGRVTELVARPLISAFFPHLAHFVQPLSGEYAGWRDVLETVPFVEGYGVELGLLVDLVDRVGSDAVAQVDLGVREHRNRPLTELAPQAMEVLLVALRRSGVSPEQLGTTLWQRSDKGFPTAVTVETRERPPMIEVSEYLEKFPRAASERSGIP